MSPDAVFSLCNALALLAWIALIASPARAPWSARVRWLTGRAVPVVLSAVYALMLLTHWRGEGGFGSPAEVRALFPIPRLGVVAGCRVTRGIIQRTSHVRVVRQGKVLHTGTISSLRVFKDDVKEFKDGFECGIVVDGFPGVQEGDTIQSFEVEAITPSL